MRYLILISIFLILSTLSVNGQEKATIKRNGIYTELYGIQHDFNQSFISFNYERLVGKKNLKALRIGIYPDFESELCFPITYTWITSPLKHHHIEYGAGMVFRLEFYEGNIYKDITAVMFPIMYRYQKENGIYFRGGVNIWVSWPTIISPSASLGYRF